MDREKRDNEGNGEPSRLRHRHAELVRRRERVVERVALFPSPVNDRQLAELDAELSELGLRMDAIGLEP